jgi:hypothetical protein
VITIAIDFSEVLAFADDLGAARNEVGFAIVKTLNQQLFKGREAVVNEWHAHMAVHNVHFPSAVLHVRTVNSSQSPMTGAVEEVRGHILGDHEYAATREAAGHRFAIPSTPYAEGKWTAHGLRQDARLSSILQRGKRAVRIVGRKVFIATRGQRGLKYAFTLASQVQIKRDVDLSGAFERSITSTFYDQLKANLLRALRTRFS